MSLNNWKNLNQEIIGCRKCKRLVNFREKIARNKTKRFKNWNYWGKPVIGYGNKNGKLIITTPNWTNPRGYMLMTLLHLFDAKITLLDLHYLSPVNFVEWSKKLNMNLKWKTFDYSWAHGQTLINDFKKRIPKIMSELGFNKTNNEVSALINWIKKHVLTFDNSLYHSGAIGLYILTLKTDN